jgi:hypothetical protein
MIDLLPIPEKNAIRKEYHLRVFVVSLAMFSSVLAASVLSFLPTYLFTISRYGAFLSELQSDETQGRISQVKEMEMTVRETNKKIDLLKSGESASNVSSILLGILENKPRGVTITALSYNLGESIVKKGKESATPTAVGITGKSANRASLLAFKDALAQKKEFITVDLPISSLVKDTDLSFSITISMAPGDTKKIP